MNATSHIRKRYPRSTSNSHYLDRRTFDEGKYITWTFCGAEVTDRDVAWAARKTKWTRANACQACVSAVTEIEMIAS